MDINCPYCNAEQDIDHDDGAGYSEDVTHNQQCAECKKYFVFTTGIIYVYHVYKADCLNGSDHDFKPTTTIPRESTNMECTMCGEERSPTAEEMAIIIYEHTKYKRPA